MRSATVSRAPNWSASTGLVRKSSAPARIPARYCSLPPRGLIRMKYTYGCSGRARATGLLRLRLQGRAHRGEQHLGVHGLGEHRGDAQRRDALPGVGIAAAGHNEYGDGGERLDLAQPFQDEIPIAGGESQVEQ